MPIYQFTNLQAIKKTTFWFSIDTLRDAAIELKESKEIVINDNTKHIYNIELKVLDKGIKSYKEKAHYWTFLKSWRIMIISLIAFLATIALLIKRMLSLFR